MMQPKQFKELWEIRFQKILEGEKEALLFYRNLLKENEQLFRDTKAKRMLEDIRRDEAKHVRIARRLLNLVRQKNSSKE